MLTSLQIENYAIIRSLEIPFQQGLIVITGETGAGKSILMGALSLILGNRADTDVLELCLDGIGRDLENIHNGNSAARQVVLIVPAQFTLEAEEAAFRKFDAKGFFDLHPRQSQHSEIRFGAVSGHPLATPDPDAAKRRFSTSPD